jgi:hypothetical protein
MGIDEMYLGNSKIKVGRIIFPAFLSDIDQGKQYCYYNRIMCTQLAINIFEQIGSN